MWFFWLVSKTFIGKWIKWKHRVRTDRRTFDLWAVWLSLQPCDAVLYHAENFRLPSGLCSACSALFKSMWTSRSAAIGFGQKLNAHFLKSLKLMRGLWRFTPSLKLVKINLNNRTEQKRMALLSPSRWDWRATPCRRINKSQSVFVND